MLCMSKHGNQLLQEYIYYISLNRHPGVYFLCDSADPANASMTMTFAASCTALTLQN